MSPRTARRSAQSQFRTAAALLLGLLFPATRPLAAAIITVGGACNLNAAIEAANTDSPKGGCMAGSGADVIRLTGGIVLTAVDNDTDGANGLPSVSSKITLEGGGLNVLRDLFTAPPFRILHVAESGDLTLEDLVLSFGLTDESGSGGGIYNRGTLTLRNTTVSYNLAHLTSLAGRARGGGIFNQGAARIYDSRVTANSAESEGPGSSYAEGGGVYSDGTLLHIEGTTIDGNVAVGGRFPQGGGLWIAGFPARLTILDSTISGNSAQGELSWGGGIYLSDWSRFLISNSTVSGNNVTSDPVYGPSSGGGVYTDDGVGTIQHTTFCGNAADYGAALFAGSGTTVIGSLFANSTGNHCRGDFVDGGGGNLADDDTCRLTIADTLAGLDPILADNGGPTRTHELEAGSTAIDVAGSCGLGTDQRGAGRMTPCDAGAYEYLGCDLVEYGRTIEGPYTTILEVCHTGLLGPDLVVDGATNGDFRVRAGHLITLRNGFEVQEGAGLELVIEPALLPP